MNLQAQYPSREEQAKAEIGVTAISRRAAASTVIVFLATIVAVPLIDLSVGGLPTWRLSSTAGDVRARLRGFETALEGDSALGRAARPWVQAVLTRGMASGSDTVYCGRDGWLFYEPDVRHITGRGFLDPSSDAGASARGRRSEVARHTDPIAAIVNFKEALRARGAELVIVPTPVKPAIHPEMLWPGVAAPLENPSLDRFKAELSARGVLVFDVAPLLATAARGGQSQFLATDTHWRPEAMELAAARLAEFVAERVALPQSLGVEYRHGSKSIRNRGDLAALLQVPRPSDWETVTTHPVLQPDGQPWAPRADAEILWLGDSFSNIYSARAMGWGEAAGFAEQFSHRLGRPLDALRRNDHGAVATRELLADELARGNDRLAGKRLVIWQFAARELSIGDWRPIELKLVAPPARRLIVPPPGESWIATGVVAGAGLAPRPGNVAYRDHVLATHLTQLHVEGGLPGTEAVVYLRSMTDGKLTAAAGLRVGQHVRLKLRDWSEVSRQYDFIRRSDLPDSELRAQPACWGELLD